MTLTETRQGWRSSGRKIHCSHYVAYPKSVLVL